jgi:hypothetical protein
MTKTLMHQKNALQIVARQEVVGVLRELLSDPDSGLSLRKAATRRLGQSVRSKTAGQIKNLQEILNHHGR